MKDRDYHKRSYQAVTSAIHELSLQFDNVSIPLRHNFYYDLLCERKFKIYRVKVIYTNCKQPNGNYVANIRKSGGYSSQKELKAPFDPNFCDFLYIECPNDKYLIPSCEISTHRAITLNQYESFRISSAVEQRPVKPLVVGSNPTSGVCSDLT
jgi:PD-(D/E)XK endonuclease